MRGNFAKPPVSKEVSSQVRMQANKYIASEHGRQQFCLFGTYASGSAYDVAILDKTKSKVLRYEIIKLSCFIIIIIVVLLLFPFLFLLFIIIIVFVVKIWHKDCTMP